MKVNQFLQKIEEYYGIEYNDTQKTLISKDLKAYGEEYLLCLFDVITEEYTGRLPLRPIFNDVRYKDRAYNKYYRLVQKKQESMKRIETEEDREPFLSKEESANKMAELRDKFPGIF